MDNIAKVQHFGNVFPVTNFLRSTLPHYLLHRHTTEFEYRFNNRKDTGVNKFDTALGGADTKRLKYATLMGKSIM